MYEASGSIFASRDGWAVPALVGSTAGVLETAREGVAAFDLSHLSHAFHDRISDELADTITRDVRSLGDGSCTEALILDEGGKISSHLDIWMNSAAFLYWRTYAAGPGSHAIVALVGPDAGAVVGSIFGEVPQSGRVFGSDWHGVRVLCAGNGPAYGRTATIAMPVDVAAEVMSAAMAEGTILGGVDAFHALRTRAGELDWGADGIPPLTPLEADLTHLVDPEATFTGRRSYRRALRKGNERVVVGFRTDTCQPQAGDGLRAGDSHGFVISVATWPDDAPSVGMGWLEPAPVFHRGSKAFGDPLPQLEAHVDGTWFPVSLADPPFFEDVWND